MGLADIISGGSRQAGRGSRRVASSGRGGWALPQQWGGAVRSWEAGGGPGGAEQRSAAQASGWALPQQWGGAVDQQRRAAAQVAARTAARAQGQQSQKVFGQLGAFAGAVKGLIGGPPPVGGAPSQAHVDWQAQAKRLGTFLGSLGGGLSDTRSAAATAVAQQAAPQGRYAAQQAGLLRNALGGLGVPVPSGQTLARTLTTPQGMARAGQLAGGAWRTIQDVGTQLGQEAGLRERGEGGSVPASSDPRVMAQLQKQSRQDRLDQSGFFGDVRDIGAGLGKLASSGVGSPQTATGTPALAGLGISSRTGFDAPLKLAKAAVSDVFNIPAQTPGLLAELATHPGRTVRQVVKTDPIVQSIKQGSLGPLQKAFAAHPLAVAGELGGIGGAFGRAAGVGGRLGASALGKDVGPGSVLHYGPEARTVGGINVERQFSKNPAVNVLQRRAEVGAGVGLGRMERVLPGRTGEAARLRAKGVAEKQVSERAGAQQGARRRVAFLQEKGYQGQLLGRAESAVAAAGHAPDVGRAQVLAHAIPDARLRGAVQRTGVAGLVLEGQVRPGHLVEDLKTKQASLNEAALELNKTHEAGGLAQGFDKITANKAQRELVAAALARPKDLALIERNPGALDQHAAYVGGLDRQAVALGYLPEHRLKAQYVPGLVTHLGARSGGKADAYLTAAGEENRALREHAQALSESHGALRGDLRAAETARTRTVADARVAAAKVGREPQVRKLEQALVARATHERNQAAAAGRGDTALATRHEGMADAANVRAREAATGLPKGTASKITEAVGRERAARLAAAETQAAARSAGRAHQEHAAGAKAAGTPLSRTPWMVDKAGTPIESAAQARELLQNVGVRMESLAHVTERGPAGGGAYYQPGSMKARFPGSKQRTGEATRLGLADLSHKAVVDDIHAKRTSLEAVRAHIELMRNVTMKAFGTPEEAHKFIDGLKGRIEADEHGLPVPVSEHGLPALAVVDIAGPFQKLSEIEARAHAMDQHGKPVGTPEDLTRELQGAAVPSEVERGAPAGSSAGLPDAFKSARYQVVPRAALSELAAHTKSLDPADWVKGLQKASALFRRTVLLTSTRWLAGNTVEGLFRTVVMHGMHPGDWWAGKRVTQDIASMHGKRTAQEFVNATYGPGGHVGMAFRLDYHRGVGQWRGEFATGFAKLYDRYKQGKISSVNVLGRTWDLWKQVIGGYNTWMEHQLQRTVVGRQVREDVKAARGAGLGPKDMSQLHEFNGLVERALSFAGPAYVDVLKGMGRTARQERYVDAIYRVHGQYNGFNASLRRVVEVAPFFPWYLNAVKFMAALPFRHPVKAGAVDALYQAGTDKLTKQGHTLLGGGLPPYLAVGTVDVPGGHMPLGHYLPFGATDISSAPGLIFPLAGAASSAVQGQTFSGQKITGPGGKQVGLPDAILLALNGTAESIVPGMAIFRRVEERGQTSSPWSTVYDPKVKQTGSPQGIAPTGPWGAGLEKVFNPFHVIPQATNTGKGRGGGGSVTERLARKYGLKGGGASSSRGSSSEAQRLAKKYGLKGGDGSLHGQVQGRRAYAANVSLADRTAGKYETPLSPQDERRFQAWKARHAPLDSGSDYDFRGAYKAGVRPSATGHWPDTFKKPNEPTFSVESRYATGANSPLAGHWAGERYIASPHNVFWAIAHDRLLRTMGRPPQRRGYV